MLCILVKMGLSPHTNLKCGLGSVQEQWLQQRSLHPHSKTCSFSTVFKYKYWRFSSEVSCPGLFNAKLRGQRKPRAHRTTRSPSFYHLIPLSACVYAQRAWSHGARPAVNWFNSFNCTVSSAERSVVSSVVSVCSTGGQCLVSTVGRALCSYRGLGSIPPYPLTSFIKLKKERKKEKEKKIWLNAFFFFLWVTTVLVIWLQGCPLHNQSFADALRRKS